MSHIENRLPKAVVVGANETKVVGVFPTTKDLRTSLRVDLYVGKVAGTGALKIQDSSGFGIWRDVKSVTLTASTDKTCVVSAATGIITSTSHGFDTDTPISFATSDALPDPLIAGAIYYVDKIDADTFRLKAAPGLAATLSFQGGSGNHTATAVRVVSITVQSEVAEDQEVTPLKDVCRVMGVMGDSQSCQVCAVKVC